MATMASSEQLPSERKEEEVVEDPLDISSAAGAADDCRIGGLQDKIKILREVTFRFYGQILTRTETFYHYSNSCKVINMDVYALNVCGSVQKSDRMSPHVHGMSIRATGHLHLAKISIV